METQGAGDVGLANPADPNFLSSLTAQNNVIITCHCLKCTDVAQSKRPESGYQRVQTTLRLRVITI